jgi:hypothetical protein
MDTPQNKTKLTLSFYCQFQKNNIKLKNQDKIKKIIFSSKLKINFKENENDNKKEFLFKTFFEMK